MKYRKKPVIVEAIQFTGDNREEVLMFCNGYAAPNYDYLFIKGIRGMVDVHKGDWVIKQNAIDYYPCPNEVFNEVYEKVSN